jgi:ornithine cyclodeaminase/alanine dehydrogenase-like protein (mu-crystallin family)
MLILNAAEVRQALPMRETIEAMKSAYAALSTGQATVPLRTRLAVDRHNGLGLFMPASVQSDDEEALAIKLVTLFNDNPAKGLPLIHAAVVVMHPQTGQMLAVLEGGTLTAIRTGAGCGAATDLLARKEASTLAIIGAGAQARTQLEAVCAVREIESAWIYAPTRSHVEALIAEMAGNAGVPKDLRAASSAKEAVQAADIVSAATTSDSPVFEFSDLKAGAHINGAGSYTPEMQEAPAELIAKALVTVDSRAACLAEAGDLIVPIRAGLVSEDVVHAEIGEIVAAMKTGRTSKDQFTFFKSVGVAVQDAVAGQFALRNAEAMGLGTEVDW